MLIAPAPVLVPEAGAHTAVADVPDALGLLAFELGSEGRFDAADQIDDNARLLAVGGRSGNHCGGGAQHGKDDPS